MTLPDVSDSLVVDMVEELVIGDIDAAGQFTIRLAPYEGKSLIVGLFRACPVIFESLLEALLAGVREKIRKGSDRRSFNRPWGH